MDTKKIQDNLAVLQHQLDSANKRLNDPFYSDIREWMGGQIKKLETEINKLKSKLK